ncbi:MAG TPA: DUF6496 domain-containing protein [Chitinophagaceae bacterium]|nr:DUF6496 domain-containing protein [Chitinophagaceae bacterium]
MTFIISTRLAQFFISYSIKTLIMAKYSKAAQKKVERAMHEKKRGTLKSGRSGKKVTSREQAIAIGLSEAREAGAKVPKKAGAKKTTRKTARKKTATKKTARKVTSGRRTAKRTTRRKTTTKKVAGKKTARKRG